MTAPAAVLEKHDKMRALLDHLLTLLTPHQKKVDFSIASVVETSGLGENARNYGADFIEMGILQRDGPYYGNGKDLPVGRHYDYTLLVTPEAARAILNEQLHQREQQISQNKAEGHAKSGATKRAKTAARHAEETDVTRPDETVAIVGEDAPKGLGSHIDPATLASLRSTRKDESAALVEAARQYSTRTSTVLDMLDGLEAQAKELGITFDKEATAKMFSFDRDERLETVLLTLPYVDTLLQENRRLVTQNGELLAKLEQFDRIKRDYEALQRANERRIAASVGQTAVVSSH